MFKIQNATWFSAESQNCLILIDEITVYPGGHTKHSRSHNFSIPQTLSPIYQQIPLILSVRYMSTPPTSTNILITGCVLCTFHTSPNLILLRKYNCYHITNKTQRLLGPLPKIRILFAPSFNFLISILFNMM